MPPRRTHRSTPRRKKTVPELLTDSAAATQAAGAAFARTLKPGEVVIVLGQLGSGKTTFLQGVAKGLGIQEPVVSPTFVLRKRYPTRGSITAFNHVDAYRLDDPAALRGLLDEEIRDGASTDVWCVEWGGKIRSRLPKRLRVVRLALVDQTHRSITLG